MEKYLLRIKPKHYGIVAFVLTCIAMYIMFSYEEVLSTGRYIIMEGDLLQQYVPFIKMLVRDIVQGENPSFSWSLSMGMNTSLCYAYYALSPFNLLYLILFFVDENIVTAAIIILKTGLAARIFQYFARKTLKCTGAETIIFSMFYAMCSFQVIYNVLNIAWIDAIYMLPLLCSLLVALVKEKKWKGLVAVYAYLFITQFYMAYIVGMFSLIFLLVVFICNGKNSIRDVIIKWIMFCSSVCLAIGVAAVVWLPALIFLSNNVVGSDATVSLQLNILDIIKNMFWGQIQGYDGIYPYIYCGIASLILVPLFFVNKNITLRYKIGAGILIIVLVCCMLIDPLYLFMHAFDVPNQLGFRFAFLFSFVLCAIGCYQYSKMDKLSIKSVGIVLVAEVIIYVVAALLQVETTVGVEASQWIKLILSMVFVLIWVICVAFVQRKPDKKLIASVLCIFVAVLELVSNGFVCYQYIGSENNQRHYDVYRGSMDYALSVIEEDEDFYRVIYNNDYNYNSDSWFGYHGITDFNSAIHVRHQSVLCCLGHTAVANTNFAAGNTPVTRMLFGVKYIVDGVHPEIMALNMPNPNITENPTALSLGYMTDEDILAYCITDNYVFDNMDRLLTGMTGVEISCFEPIDDDRIIVEETNAELSYSDGMYEIRRNDENEEFGYITYAIADEEGKTLYVQFKREHIYYSNESPILLGGVENIYGNMGHFTASYAKEMIPGTGGYGVTIEISPDDVSMIRYQEADFCYYHPEELLKAYDILSQNQMNIHEYGNTYILADVTVPEERTVLFTSIPYDEGWTVYVDGVETPTRAVVNGAFLALELEPGYHELEFEYEAPGAMTGMAISGVSICVYGLLIGMEYLFVKKRKAKEGNINPDVEDRTE
ncbi:MAG: YfhO family protein [Lachnospiraceae bacterium]|nr:YfhO family protein [Lachnospiraceae bacterium]